MKVFFQTLLPKTARAEAANARLASAKAEDKTSAAGAVPQKPAASGKPASPARGHEEGASARPRLALEAGDFIDRIPHHLLRLGEFDLHRPLSFDMGLIADRIARGIFTISLSDLLKEIPEMFTDEAQGLHALDTRFPWQRVVQMVNESAAAAKENGGETLAQQLRRIRKADKAAAQAAVPDAPPGGKREGAMQLKRGAARDGENAWFSKRAITFEGADGRAEVSPEKTDAPSPAAIPKNGANRAAASPGLPQVPESAPALFELLETNGLKLATEAVTPPFPAPLDRAPASPAPNRAPVSDLMDLPAEPAPTSNSAKVGGGSEYREQVSASPASPSKSGPEDSDLKMNRTRIKFLEAQLKTLSTKHQDEVSTLKAETDRVEENARKESEKERAELMAQFQFERQRLMVAKDEELAKMAAEYRAGIAAQQKQISELRVGAAKAAGGERQDSAAGGDSPMAGLRALEARVEPLIAELASVKYERDQLAALLLQEEQRVAEIAARHEFDLFALRVESAQIVAEERGTADERIAELESRFADGPAASPEEPERPTPAIADYERALAARDLEIARLKRESAERANALDAANQTLARWASQDEARRELPAPASREVERDLLEARTELAHEREQVIAERQLLLREMTARAGTSVARKDEDLARLRAELEEAEALASAQAANHEQVAAQWEEDVQNYRQRIQFVMGEKTALAAKLREAEIALQSATRSVIGTAA